MNSWPNKISVGGLALDMDGSASRIVTNLTGWYAAPRRLGMEAKAQQDGDWDAVSSAGSRTLGIEAFAEEAGEAEAQAFARDLAALGSAGLLQVVVDNAATGPLSSWARVEVGADPEWIDACSFTYTMQLRSPDPLLYGPETFASTTLASSAGGTGLTYPLTYLLDYGVPPGVTPGAITLSNAGTAAYWPRLRIDGPVPNPSVSMVETGDSLRYNGTLAAGQWLDIDTANRRVLLNGQVSVRHLVSVTGRWLGVPVGGGSLTWTADAADPAATLSAWAHESAWY
jgi:hypothetical protein